MTQIQVSQLSPTACPAAFLSPILIFLSHLHSDEGKIQREQMCRCRWFLPLVKPLVFPLQPSIPFLCPSQCSRIPITYPHLHALPGLQRETKACKFTVILLHQGPHCNSFTFMLFLRRLNCLQISNFFFGLKRYLSSGWQPPSSQLWFRLSPSGSLFTGVARNTLNLPQMWLSVILSMVLCILPVIGYQFLKPLFWPVSVDKVSGTENLARYDS